MILVERVETESLHTSFTLMGKDHDNVTRKTN